MWGCVFSVYPFLLWWLREYIYFVLLSTSNRKYEYCPLFRVRSWNNGVPCMSFYILSFHIMILCVMHTIRSAVYILIHTIWSSAYSGWTSPAFMMRLVWINVNRQLSPSVLNLLEKKIKNKFACSIHSRHCNGKWTWNTYPGIQGLIYRT